MHGPGFEVNVSFPVHQFKKLIKNRKMYCEFSIAAVHQEIFYACLYRLLYEFTSVIFLEIL